MCFISVTDKDNSKFGLKRPELVGTVSTGCLPTSCRVPESGKEVDFLVTDAATHKRRLIQVTWEIVKLSELDAEDRAFAYVTFYDVLNELVKLPKTDIYVTGSNSKMLSRDVATNFRDRGVEIRLHPFSFSEYLAALTVTLKADGTTSLAGKLPNGVDKNDKAVTIAVSASGVANAGMMTGGALAADFAPVLTVGGKKRVLSVRTNLWFDRRNDHRGGVGAAKFVE